MSFSDIMIYDLQTKKFIGSRDNYLVHKIVDYTVPANAQAELVRFSPLLNGTVNFLVTLKKETYTNEHSYQLFCDEDIIQTGTVTWKTGVYIEQDVLAGHLYKLKLISGVSDTAISELAIKGEIVPNYDYYCAISTLFD